MLPTETSKTAAKRRDVQTEYMKVRRDLNATSSQDEFAKWAKLRRQHDKLMEQLEKMSESPGREMRNRHVHTGTALTANQSLPTTPPRQSSKAR